MVPNYGFPDEDRLRMLLRGTLTRAPLNRVVWREETDPSGIRADVAWTLDMIVRYQKTHYYTVASFFSDPLIDFELLWSAPDDRPCFLYLIRTKPPRNRSS